MTTSDYLEQLVQDKQDLVDNLTTQGIEDLTGDETFTELVPKVLDIQGGGSDGWQRPSDWWDTKTILANAENRVDDNGATVYPAYILLLADWDKQTTFSKTTSGKGLQGDSYLTSDGAWYGTTDATHTWDESKDKLCSEGYKTRYVIVYVKNTSSVGNIDLNSFNYLELIFGNITCGLYCAPGANTLNSTLNIEGFENLNLTLATYYIQDLKKLRNISLPNTYLSGQNIFTNCYSLTNINLPNLISISYTNSCFTNCYSLRTITLPDTINMTRLQFGGNLQYINIPNNYNPASLDLSYEPYLTHNCLIDIISKLKDLTGTEETHTITLGSKNTAKLSADELAVITSKGWTLGS